MMRSGTSISQRLAAGLMGTAVTGFALAGPVTTPNTFTSGSPAVAAEVNDNFSAFEAAVNDNDTRVSTLETDIETVQARNAELVKLNEDLER